MVLSHKNVSWLTERVFQWSDNQMEKLTMIDEAIMVNANYPKVLKDLDSRF